MIKPSCGVKLKHTRYNANEASKPKRPCCSKVFEKFKSQKKVKRNVKGKTCASRKKNRKTRRQRKKGY